MIALPPFCVQIEPRMGHHRAVLHTVVPSVRRLSGSTNPFVYVLGVALRFEKTLEKISFTNKFQSCFSKVDFQKAFLKVF